jgi:hypothetical protein
MVVAALPIALLSGCERPEVRTAEQSVKEKLHDPDSAIFTDVIVTKAGFVCGRVNSKNRDGEYGGPVRFFVELDGFGHAAPGAAGIELPGSPYSFIIDDGWQTHCAKEMKR